MPIHSGDVKLLKSAVMADVPEGGGAPMGIAIPDGVSNASPLPWLEATAKLMAWAQ